MSKFNIFLFLFICPIFVFSQNKQIVQDYLYKNSKSNAIEFTIDADSYSNSMKSDVLKLQQTINNLPIYNAISTAIIKQGKVQYFSDGFNYELVNTRNINPNLSTKDVLNQIFTQFNLKNSDQFSILNFEEPEKEIKNFAKQRLVYFIINEKPVLSYEFIFPENQSPNFWNVIADASTGEILKKQNLNLRCNHSEFNNEKHTINQELSYLNNDFNQEKLSLNPSSYNVFALPIESPNFGSRTIETNPYLLNASPEGWHSDGTNSFTITRGNNVYAYEDADANNLPGFSPDGGSF